MAEGTAAEKAYRSAKRAIEVFILAGGSELRLSGETFLALERIPPEVAEIEGLRSLNLNYTKVSDLSPLRTLTGLRRLSLAQTKVREISQLRNLTDLRYLSIYRTAVSDLSPLTEMRNLQTLFVSRSKVSDLRPIEVASRKSPYSVRSQLIDLRFNDIPALTQDVEMLRLSKLGDRQERVSQTLAYLKTLPPWPEPLPWLEASKFSSLSSPIRETRPVLATEAQIAALMRHALVTQVTAGQLAGQIEAALAGVPATTGNRLPDVLQAMAEVAEVLRALAPEAAAPTQPLDEAHLQLRIAQLEAIVERLTGDLADERKRREAVEALAAKDGFLHNSRKGAGLAAGAAAVGLVSIGVPAAAVYFLGVEHPMVQAVLTVLGRLPKS